MKKPLKLDKISLKEALDLLRFPKLVGNIDGREVILNNGKFGLYVSYNEKNYPVKSEKISISDNSKKVILKKSLNNDEMFRNLDEASLQNYLKEIEGNIYIDLFMCASILLLMNICGERGKS